MVLLKDSICLVKGLGYFLGLTTWKRFHDGIFAVKVNDPAAAFLDYLNNIKKAGKLKFTIKRAAETKSSEVIDFRI